MLPPYNLGFNDVAKFSLWDGIEAANPDQQALIIPCDHPAFKWAARLSQRPGDVWQGNNTIRCLVNKLDTAETTGQTRSYWIPFRLDTQLSDNLLWELHHPASLYNLPSGGVAPHAMLVQGGALVWRTATGNLTPTGWPTWLPNQKIAGFEKIELGRWIEVAAEIQFREEPTGSVKVMARYADQPWPTSPQINLANIPTMPYSSSRGVTGVKLYTEAGLYRGTNTLSQAEAISLGGVFARTSLAEAMNLGRTTIPEATGSPVVSPQPPASPTVEQRVAALEKTVQALRDALK